MKNQEETLEYYEPDQIRIDTEKPKKFLTKSGDIIIVSKKQESIQGCTGKKTYYVIDHNGKILKPFQSIGIKNYIKRN